MSMCGLPMYVAAGRIEKKQNNVPLFLRFVEIILFIYIFNFMFSFDAFFLLLLNYLH